MRTEVTKISPNDPEPEVIGKAVDIRCSVAHHAVFARTQVRPADVVAPNHKDFGLVLGVGRGDGK